VERWLTLRDGVIVACGYKRRFHGIRIAARCFSASFETEISKEPSFAERRIMPLLRYK
jgi:nucleotidyltransferase/DNA polymerase involved in DNA repair